MIIKSKRIIGCLLILISLNSCDKKIDFDNYDITLANIFSIYGDDIEKDIIFFNKKNKVKQSSLTILPNDRIDSINTIIQKYYNYLNEIDLKSEKLSKNIFYEEGVLVEEGIKFQEESVKFLNDLNQIVRNNDLKEDLDYLFNINDVINQDNIYIKYLDYYYLGVPYPVFKYLIKKRKLDLVLFIDQILNQYLIDKDKL